MADIKWSAFTNVGAIENGDIIVGLRGGVNVQLAAPVYNSQVVIESLASLTMVPNTIYITDDVSSVITYALPTTSAFGDRLSVVGFSADGYVITQAAGQQIHVGSLATTLGSGGSIASTNQYDSINLICIIANTTWATIGGPQGNFTII